MGEFPKLYDNKPKKAQMKQVKGIDAKASSKPSSSSSLKTASPAISSYYSTGSSSHNVGGGGGGGGGGGAVKPPEVPKESFAKRYKYVWPLLLTVNLAVGAYLFMRTKKKDVLVEEEFAHTTPASTPTPSTSITPTAAAAVTEATLPAPQPVRVPEPIPTVQQRELFKWMLEEKRKIKTNDPEEKKRIDEEKAILKQFIRAKSIPNI